MAGSVSQVDLGNRHVTRTTTRAEYQITRWMGNRRQVGTQRGPDASAAARSLTDMVDLSALLTDEDLRRRYGTPTLDRAWDYVRRGKVLTCEHALDADGDLDIQGSVSGSTSAPYAVRISVGDDGEGVWIAGRCSCPVHDGCKHVLALLITVRDEHIRSSPDHGRRWERQLSSLLDELDERSEQTRRPSDKPLALQLDLRRPTPGGLRGYTGWSDGGRTTTSPVRGTLRLRPMKRGARDNWVRTNISWSTVPYLDRHGHPPEQAAALNDLLSAHRAATRQMYFGADAHLSLGTFGPDEVALLRRAADAGIAILPGAGLSQVELAGPVELRLDVNGAPGEDARLQVGVPLGDEWYSAADLDVLGEGGHTVALWFADGDAWSVTLAPLAAPPGPELRRLLRHGDSLVVPADDRDDLVAEYLPRLQRHVPVVSSDGTVVLPEPAEPRLVLAITWVAADEVRVAWTWHYRVGSDDRVYALSETRGLRGVRRPEAEQAALDALVLDDEQAYHLCRAHRREPGWRTATRSATRTPSCSPRSCSPGCASRSRSTRPARSPTTARSRAHRSSTSRPARAPTPTRRAPTGSTSRWR